MQILLKFGPKIIYSTSGALEMPDVMSQFVLGFRSSFYLFDLWPVIINRFAQSAGPGLYAPSDEGTNGRKNEVQ